MNLDTSSEISKNVDLSKKNKQSSDVKEVKMSKKKEQKDQKEQTELKNSENTAKELETKLEELQKLSEEQKTQIAELNDKYLRSLADRDNLVKRTQKEKEAISKYALETFMLDFLPVLDSLDKVEASFTTADGSNDSTAYKEGFSLVKQQILKVLQKHGVESFSSVGEKFDPNRHQAMSRVESDEVEIETVKEEYLKGYTINGKLLRASFVVVQVPKSK